jgi:serine/threonine protein kinase
MPPEVLSGAHTEADPAIDIWTIGVMTFLMLFGRYPFDEGNSEATIKAIIESPFGWPSKPLVSNEAMDLIKRMLDKNPGNRKNILDLEEHPWFTINPDLIHS